MEQQPKPTHRKHNKWHDYSSSSIYHITLVVSDREPLLGQLEEVSGTQAARMQLTPLGMDVADCIRGIPVHGMKKGLDLQILAQQVMDTHIHFVLYVRKHMGQETLGDIIRGLKIGCNKALRRLLESPSGCEGTVYPKSPRLLHDHALFEEDFDETILKRRGQLKRMIDYVHENPYRKLVKRHNKDRFVPVRKIEVAGKLYDAIGNLMLLGLARKEVHVRSRFSDEERKDYTNDCVTKARQNYALVSPFISDYESAVRDFCLQEGHSVIQLVDNGFTDFTTCPGGLFEFCQNGQVLLLAPSELPHIDKKGTISRAECQFLNARSSEITEEQRLL